MAFKALFLAHAPDADYEKNNNVIDRSWLKSLRTYELSGAAVYYVLLLCSTVITTFPFLCPLSTYL